MRSSKTNTRASGSIAAALALLALAAAMLLPGLHGVALHLHGACCDNHGAAVVHVRHVTADACACCDADSDESGHDQPAPTPHNESDCPVCKLILANSAAPNPQIDRGAAMFHASEGDAAPVMADRPYVADRSAPRSSRGPPARA